MARLCEAGSKVCSYSEKYSQDVAAAFSSTILTNMIILKVVAPLLREKIKI